MITSYSIIHNFDPRFTTRSMYHTSASTQPTPPTRSSSPTCQCSMCARGSFHRVSHYAMGNYSELLQSLISTTMISTPLLLVSQSTPTPTIGWYLHYHTVGGGNSCDSNIVNIVFTRPESELSHIISLRYPRLHCKTHTYPSPIRSPSHRHPFFRCQQS